MADTSIPQRGIIRAMTTIREDAIDLRGLCLPALRYGRQVCLGEIDYFWIAETLKLSVKNQASISTAPRRASPLTI